MAYNRKNHLKDVIDFQDAYLKYKQLHRGATNKFIHEEYFLDGTHGWRMCKRTFDGWLGIPAKRDLKRILEAEAKQLEVQPQLFGNDEENK